jgi:hypothetical protein
MPEQNTRELSIYVVGQASLEHLKAALGDERLTWAYASRMEDTGLGWLRDLLDEQQPLGAPLSDGRPGVPLARWSEGRAFGPELEVDWWRDGGTYRLRALLEEGKPPQGVDWGKPVSTALKANGGERSVLLHGELDKDRSASAGRPTWSEARIPRYLVHPCQIQEGTVPPKQVALVAQDYARNGAVVLTRLLKVAAPQG